MSYVNKIPKKSSSTLIVGFTMFTHWRKKAQKNVKHGREDIFSFKIGIKRKIFGSRAVDGKRYLQSNASSILGTLTSPHLT